jgi:hypothetical protein
MDLLSRPQGWWDFQQKSIVTFGTAVRLRGFFGVGTNLGLVVVGTSTDEAHQEDVLYLTDPAGLRSILSGERSDVYDEFPLIIKYVSSQGWAVLYNSLTIRGPEPRRNRLFRGPGLLHSNGRDLLLRGLSPTCH